MLKNKNTPFAGSTPANVTLFCSAPFGNLPGTKFSSTMGWHHCYEKNGKSQGSGNDAADGIKDPGDRDFNLG
jgi:hypothetical protein